MDKKLVGKKHNYFNVLNSLRRKNDVKIADDDYKKDNDISLDIDLILVLNKFAPFKANDVGNGTWGKIDYLCKVFNYKLKFVKTF